MWKIHRNMITNHLLLLSMFIFLFVMRSSCAGFPDGLFGEQGRRWSDEGKMDKKWWEREQLRRDLEDKGVTNQKQLERDWQIP